MKSKVTPTINQKKVFDKVVKQVANGGKVSVAKAAREAGLAKSYTRNTHKITKSKGWEALMKQYLPDKMLIDNHKKMFGMKQVSYFMFPKSMKDEDIITHVAASGIEVITVREGEKGKMAFYSQPDANAFKNALEMGYKLKGRYKKDDDDDRKKVFEIKQIIILAPNGHPNSIPNTETIRSVSSTEQ